MHDPTNDHPKLLLTPREAARVLSISTRTLWSLTQPRGDIPSTRINRCVRYAVGDLEKWIEEQKQDTP